MDVDLTEKIPKYSRDLIKHLANMYPERLPQLEESEREMFFYAGRASLVKELVELLNLQDEEDFPNVQP